MAAYTGATAVNEGTMIVTGSLTGSSAVNVAAGAGLELDGMLNPSATAAVSGTLSGVGTAGLVTVETGGVFAPGLASGVGTTGTFTVNNTLDLTGTSTLSIRVGVGSATASDQVYNGGTGITLLQDATLRISTGSALNSLANIGLTYVIINGGAGDTGPSHSETFTEGSGITTSGGYTFDILYATNFNGTASGNDIVLELVAIPEPGPWAMLAGAMAVLGCARSRKQKS